MPGAWPLEFCQGLPRFGLKQERRRIRIVVSDTDIELLTSPEALEEGKAVIKVNFFLPAGCYATTILRELLNYQDMTTRVDKRELNNAPDSSLN